MFGARSRIVRSLILLESVRPSLGSRGLSLICLGASLSAIVLVACGTTAIQPSHTYEELKDQCERRGGRWHDGDPQRSFCEYNSMR